MLLFCEECGEKYVIDNIVSSDQPMVFTCKNCGETITAPFQPEHKTTEETGDKK